MRSGDCVKWRITASETCKILTNGTRQKSRSTRSASAQAGSSVFVRNWLVESLNGDSRLLVSPDSQRNRELRRRDLRGDHPVIRAVKRPCDDTTGEIYQAAAQRCRTAMDEVLLQPLRTSVSCAQDPLEGFQRHAIAELAEISSEQMLMVRKQLYDRRADPETKHREISRFLQVLKQMSNTIQSIKGGYLSNMTTFPSCKDHDGRGVFDPSQSRSRQRRPSRTAAKGTWTRACETPPATGGCGFAPAVACEPLASATTRG